MPNIFQMFSQVKAARDRSDSGLGIGLALSRGLIALHSGRLEASSSGLGKGSEFSVHLPTSVQGLEITEPPPVPAVAGNRHRRILVADDNVDAGESLAMLLR